jgi:hypothetical protein
MTTINVLCRCGALAMAISGEPLAHLYCHCDDCQAVHGAAYVPAVLYRFEQTRLLSRAPTLWTLRHTTRATCPVCGTRFYAEPPGQWLRSVSATLLPPGTFRPTCHINCRYALLPVRDDLPHFAGFPAAFGGSDERVPW